MDKQSIIERRRELDHEADRAGVKAAVDAIRHTKAKQGEERLGLMKACHESGGHVFGRYVFPEHCAFCGAEKNTAQATIGRNLSTAAPLTGYGALTSTPDAGSASR